MEDKNPWQEVLGQISSADFRSVAERIRDAETFLYFCMQELADSPDHELEKQALQSTIRELGRIQTEELGYPDWRKLGPS
jgi:hypothetical protein